MSTQLMNVLKHNIAKEVCTTDIRGIELFGCYEDEGFCSGFFKTAAGTRGSFSYSKISWASVVNVY